MSKSAESESGQTTSRSRPLVAIAGNPNAGKTTLFNALTGARQKVGNYAGVTVEKVSGDLQLVDGAVECLDIPGMYSLAPVSEDERVAAQALLGRTEEGLPDLTVCVIDASNLERNLYLFTQIAELRRPLLVALTMVDRVSTQGQEINILRLQDALGVDVVPIVGHKDQGVEELKKAIERNLADPQVCDADFGFPAEVETRARKLRERLARMGVDVSSAEVRRALLQPEDYLNEQISEMDEMVAAFAEGRKDLKEKGLDRPSIEVSARYSWAARTSKATITQKAKP